LHLRTFVSFFDSRSTRTNPPILLKPYHFTLFPEWLITRNNSSLGSFYVYIPRICTICSPYNNIQIFILKGTINNGLAFQSRAFFLVLDAGYWVLILFDLSVFTPIGYHILSFHFHQVFLFLFCRYCLLVSGYRSIACYANQNPETSNQ
jgi:hypothetical protein